MPARSLPRRLAALTLTLPFAVTLASFDTSPADARGIKFRSYSATRSAHAGKADSETRASGSPFSVRIYGFGSSSQDERSAARAKPQGSAAAAAARARAALEAESASRPSAPAVHTPLPAGETRSYGNGVMCVAGC
jgi:hypothetical protein